MPRDTAGNYTLPAGNPVASGEIISASWANSTMNDLGQSLSASLDRYGRGGMLAPFQFTDGTESAPGATWSNEPTTGLYRSAYGDLRFTLTGTDVQRWTSANAYLWRNSQWEEILTQAGGGGDTTINNLVVTGSFTSPGIDDNATSTQITVTDTDVNFSGNIDVTGTTTLADVDVVDLDVTGSFTSPGIDDNATSTAITIDASGNVGIGAAPSSIDAGQISLEAQGRIRVGRADGTTLQLNRTNSVGEIANFYYDGSQKGSIEVTDNGVALSGGGNGGQHLRIDAAGVTEVTGGFLAAQPGAGNNAIAIGQSAGLTSQSAGAVAIGAQSGESTQGLFGVAVGNAAGYTGQGDSAVAAGHGAGQTTQGANAVAVGNAAGNDQQGASSVAVGAAAGQDSQGEYGTAVGFAAGQQLQSANAVAIGNTAGQATQGVNAVAVGRDAGKTTQGSSAIAMGFASGQTTQGGYAIAIGDGAGNVTQGDYAVSMGYYAGVTNQGDNSIAIGNRAGQTNQAANGIIISSSGVTRNSQIPGHIMLNSSEGSLILNPTDDTWTFSGGDVVVPNDNLLVGTTSNPSAGKVAIDYARGTSAGMRIKDTAGAGGTGVIADFYNSSNVSVGSITHDSSTASYNPSSDARLKENIRDYDNALGAVMKLRPRKYSWKVNGAEDNGFIAQELLETPEFANRVNPISDGDDPLYGVDYMKFVAVLTGAIQEQQAMIETLQAEVAALKGA